MTNEERAQAFRDGPLDNMVERLAAAFAEVEAEAKRECATAFAKEQCAPIEARIKELIDGATIPEVELPLPSFQKLKKAYLDSLPDPDPGTSGLPVPQFCQECGKKPCETFIVCTMKEMERSAQRSIDGYQRSCADMLATLGTGGREAVVPLPTCTCGAASCGSRLHSSWCDAA